ncbi:MAG: cyclopropane-fatty-acyl-phospholipid synthase [Micavibrio sp.]|nr:cyclopropane-fatty-acyl-phospholipid synthase [Micavibrio sp.]
MTLDHNAAPATSPLQEMKYQPSPALRLLLGLASNWQIGTAHVQLPNGETLSFKGQKQGPEATLQVKRDRFARRSILGGQLGFCEGYLDGDWASPDPARWMELFLRNEHAMQQALVGKPLQRGFMKVVHALRPNTRKGSRKNISQHYDLGNDFYAHWLDPSMTYSSALYGDAVMTLEQAQENKNRVLAERLGITAQHRVLEIGCGWGGFSEYVAKNIGARVTAITISQQQFEYARDRIAKAGLSKLVDIQFKDYRDVTGSYDRIVSIEMIEAVGELYWPEYFKILNNRLNPGGRAGIQAITIDEGWFNDYRNTADFIQKYIFPGGMLPTKSIIRQQAEAAGMNLESMDGFGADYARTLREWQEKFQQQWPQIASAHFDDRFKRIWELYLAYCEAGFNARTIDVVHAVMTKY